MPQKKTVRKKAAPKKVAKKLAAKKKSSGKKKAAPKKVTKKKSAGKKKAVKKKAVSRKKAKPKMVKKGNTPSAEPKVYNSDMGLEEFNIADLSPFDDTVFNSQRETPAREMVVAATTFSSRLSFFVGLFFGAIVLHALLLSILVFIST